MQPRFAAADTAFGGWGNFKAGKSPGQVFSLPVVDASAGAG